VGCRAEPPLLKIVRALGEPARAQADLTPPDIEGTPSDANLVRHDPRRAAGREPEDVHRFRVATRRYDLQTFAAVLDREWTRALRAELRWLAGLVGAVRDIDVITERLRTQAPPRTTLFSMNTTRQGWSIGPVRSWTEPRSRSEGLSDRSQLGRLRQAGSKPHKPATSAWPSLHRRGTGLVGPLPAVPHPTTVRCHRWPSRTRTRNRTGRVRGDLRTALMLDCGFGGRAHNSTNL